MKWLLAVLFVITTVQAQPIQQHNISDDGWAHVPLQFPFPLYGRVFTDSFMFSNGVVGFGSVSQGWCCNGFNLDTQRGYQFNYSIMPLQTDLINYGSGRFRTQGDSTFQRYMWENISEYGVPGNLNTFGVEIRPSGFIGMYYQNVNISQWRSVTSGITGDTTLGEYQQFYHGSGFNRTNFEYTVGSTGNMCLSNPLSSPSCPGYQEAYDNLQCSQNPLYRPACPGYEQAYLELQCSANPLYSTQCAGYQQAYHDQQCALNPLHANTCPGYETAYFNQQCSLNALYNTTCPGYQTAYFNQQCSLNSLYDRQCPGYAEAYALANVVPVTRQSSNLSVTPAVPQLTTTLSGTVSVTTPVIADPVVNEVITRPASTITVTTTVSSPSAPQASVTQPVSAEKKEDSKKDSDKPSSKANAEVKKPSSGEVKNDVTVGAPVIAQPNYEYKAPIILDPLYKQMVKRPIKDNNMAMYHLLVTSNKKYEELLDGQWNRKGN